MRGSRCRVEFSDEIERKDGGLDRCRLRDVK